VSGDLSSLRSSHAGCDGLIRNRVVQLRPGLLLSAIEGVDTGGEDVVAEVPAGIALSLMLAGHAETRCGRSDMTFGVPRGDPVGTMLAFEDVECFVRKRAPGMPVAYVGLTMSREWIDDGHEGASGAFRQFASRHMARHQWNLTARTAWLTRRLLDAPAGSGIIARLQAESRALELVAEVFAQIDPEPVDLSGPALARIRRVRALIEEAPETIAGMDALAQFAGINATTLQEQFRAAYGTTVFACIRSVRLERAIAALRDGDTIANAAFIAGYASPANFATAVKRRYGVSPSTIRLKRYPG